MPRLSHYELRRVIGTGGLADVWSAVDERTGDAVAIKRLRDSLPASDAALLVREAKAMGRARHPNVVELLEVVEDDGHIALVMELCAGSLEGWVRAHGPLPPAAVAEVGLQMLCGLSHAHGRRVLHLDVKPANVLVAHDGTIKIADFGIAAVTERIDSMTQTSALWGTLPFLAPERRYGWTPSEATDLYSCAMTLAWLATGTSVGELYVPTTQERLRGTLPEALVEVLIEAARYDADERYASADAMRSAMQAALDELEPVQIDLTEIPREPALDTIGPRTSDRRGPSAESRLPMAVLAISAVVAGVGAGIAGWALLRDPVGAAVAPMRSQIEPPGSSELATAESAGLVACERSASEIRSVATLGPRESIDAVGSDLDRDGHVDLVFTNQLDESLTIYWGGADDVFADPSTVQVGRSNAAATVGDVDEDGIIDLVTTHVDEGSIAVSRGQGDRMFAAPQRIVQAPTAVRVSLVDWDGDAHLDLLMVVREGGRCTAWRKGRGDGSFETHTCIGPLPQYLPARTGRPAGIYRVDDDGRFVRHRRAASSLMGPARVLLTPKQVHGTIDGRYFWLGGDAPAPAPLMLVARTSSEELVVALDEASDPPQACVYARRNLGARHITDITDVNADGLPDLLAIDTCAGCQSNHIVSLAFP